VDSFWFKDTEKSVAEAWLDGYMQLLGRYSNGQQYQNYPRRNTANYAQAFWGDAYPALQQVKADYDPLNVFDFPMGIKPAEAAPSPGLMAEARAITFEPHYEQFKQRKQRGSG
jgi:hypothetical protein